MTVHEFMYQVNYCIPNAVLGICWGVHCLDDEYTSVKLNWIISEIKVKTSNEIVIKEATDVNSQNKFGPISAGVQGNTLSPNSNNSMRQGITDDMDSETSEGKLTGMLPCLRRTVSTVV